MRVKAFAMQLLLANTSVPTPMPISEFPFTFTLAEYVACFWRVKTWRMEVTYDCDFVESGVTYNFAGSYVEHYDNGAGFNDERNFVQDTFERAVATDTAIPWVMGLNTEVGTATAFEVGGAFPYEPRGYWTGENGGIAGDVIPRWKYGGSITIDSATITPAYPGRSPEFNFSSYLAGTTGFLGSTSNALTFFGGRTTDITWEVSTGASPPTSSVTFNTLLVSITPHEYFEFSDGVTPVWDSATGEQLIDPLSVD